MVSRENYYEIKGEQMHLDKDILHKGNKIYSSKTCIFVLKELMNYLQRTILIEEISDRSDKKKRYR